MLAQFWRQAPPLTEPAASAPVAPASTAEVAKRIVILNANRLAADFLRRMLQATFFGATISLAASLTDVDDLLTENSVDLLVSDISASDGDAVDRIPSWVAANRGAKRSLVVTEHFEPAVVHTLALAPIAGALDTSQDGFEFLAVACQSVANGGSYRSTSFDDSLLRSDFHPTGIFRVLTPTEQMVLGVIGDGCDDETAAASLPLTAQSIRSVREALHRKFAVQHKGQLIDRAAEYGFVIRTKTGIVRPGLKSLIAAHRPPTPMPSQSAIESVA